MSHRVSSTLGFSGLRKHLNESLGQVPTTQPWEGSRMKKMYRQGGPPTAPHCSRQGTHPTVCSECGRGLRPGDSSAFYIPSERLTLDQLGIRPYQTKHARSLRKTKRLIKNVKWAAQGQVREAWPNDCCIHLNRRESTGRERTYVT